LYTKPLLNLLEQYNIKATFFEVGKNIKKYPEITRLVLEKGHELANHTYSHKDMMFKSYDFLQKEINSTDELLKTAGVTETINFRPPWGRRFLVLIGMIYQEHKKIIIWDIDSEDYVKGISAETIANKVIKNIRPGAIVLMHDSGGNRSQTIKATEIIINKLTPQGYQFKTVADLLKS
jgi:peptidoglycan/xylan/chitin deacetylase (PgdA/CDA1 family)